MAIRYRLRETSVHVRGFGKVWRENPSVSSTLGCIWGPERGDKATLVVLENGTMLWIERRDTIHVDLYGSNIADSGPRLT